MKATSLIAATAAAVLFAVLPVSAAHAVQPADETPVSANSGMVNGNITEHASALDEQVTNTIVDQTLAFIARNPNSAFLTTKKWDKSNETLYIDSLGNLEYFEFNQSAFKCINGYERPETVTCWEKARFGTQSGKWKGRLYQPYLGFTQSDFLFEHIIRVGYRGVFQWLNASTVDSSFNWAQPDPNVPYYTVTDPDGYLNNGNTKATDVKGYFNFGPTKIDYEWEGSWKIKGYPAKSFAGQTIEVVPFRTIKPPPAKKIVR